MIIADFISKYIHKKLLIPLKYWAVYMVLIILFHRVF